MDLVFAALAIVLMLEITRRTAGYIIPAIAAFFLGYALWFGQYMQGLWNFPGVNLVRMLYRMYFAPDGIFGTISSTFVFLFAAFLLKSGAGDFIIRLSEALMGRMIGGPAKMAVFASGLMGSISGSAVANTVGTGSITIPLMKRVGFPPKFAGGVEAAASTGGQLMPPIMGAGAFIMSQWTQIPYLTIVDVASIPALLYFFTVTFFVHLRAKKLGLKPLAHHEIPAIGAVLKEGWHFFIPIAVLMGLLMWGFTPTFSACAGIAAHLLIFWYSQDANVTPPVCLAAYSAAGISGSKPLETGIESWKLAKGLYIIPLLFVYTPILFEGPLWRVAETSVMALLGLFTMAVVFEGYHLRALSWLERLFFLGVTVLLL